MPRVTAKLLGAQIHMQVRSVSKLKQRLDSSNERAKLMKQPNISVAAARLRKLSRLRPTLAMVLGSGFHHVLKDLEVAAKVPYRALPGFRPVGVTGHSGELFIGHLGGTPVLILSGRAHFYE